MWNCGAASSPTQPVKHLSKSNGDHTARCTTVDGGMCVQCNQHVGWDVWAGSNVTARHSHWMMWEMLCVCVWMATVGISVVVELMAVVVAFVVCAL